MTEYTNIEVIVFEDESGGELEMQIVDEFDYEDKHIVALAPPLDADDGEDEEVNFFAVNGDDYELIEQSALVNALADMLENRLLSRNAE